MQGDRKFETIDIAADTTEEGEVAPSITAVLENGTFYLHQQHGSLSSEPPNLQIATVGMSRGQARQVRNALNRLLEPVWPDRPTPVTTEGGGENG